jgi:hypothetical protein
MVHLGHTMECSEKPQKLHCLCVTSLILGALKFCNQWTRWHRWEAHRGKGCVFLFFVCFEGFLFPLPRGPLCVSQSPVPVHVSCLHHSYLCVYFAEYEMNPLKLKPCLLLSWSPCGTLCGLLIKYLLEWHGETSGECLPDRGIKRKGRIFFSYLKFQSYSWRRRRQAQAYWLTALTDVVPAPFLDKCHSVKPVTRCFALRIRSIDFKVKPLPFL